MMPKALLWAWAVLVVALYVVLAYGSYVTLPSYAGGLLGFDMRPMGMGDADGAAYLEAISDAGRSYYLDWLGPLDNVFILALAGLLLALAWVWRGAFGSVAGLAALAYAGFDFAENSQVSVLMQTGDQNGAADFIERIAVFTTAKFASLSVAGLATLVAWKRSARDA